MNVTDTVVMMMKSYPSLYKSRVTCLQHIFDHYYTQWVDGELVFEDPAEYTRADDWRQGEDKAIAKIASASNETDKNFAIDDLLFVREENSKNQFTNDNAEMLAHCSFHSRYNRFQYAPREFEGRHLFDMPENVKADWKEAAKELAAAISFYKFVPNSKTTAESNANTQAGVERSKEIALRYLNTLDPGKAERQRQADIAKLREAAAKLGCDIVEK